MRVNIDLDSDQVIISAGVQQPVNTLEFKRSPYATIDVQFSRGSVVQELSTDATGSFEIKKTGAYDSFPLVAAPAWVKTGSGTSTLYTFIFSLVNFGLNSLFEETDEDESVSGYSGASGWISVSGYSGYSGYDDDIDPAQLTLMGEIQWIVGGQYHKTQTLTILVDNDVVREGDTGPSTPSLFYGIFMPGITQLTGGTPNSLDDLPTVQLITGTIVELLIDSGGGNKQWLPQVLTAGISAGPGVTTPLDYDGTTNNRRWLTATGLTGASGYSGFSGQSGFSGSGISGYSGYSGAGTSGYSGFSGVQGSTGSSGQSGYSGFSGAVGSTGSTGTSGFSGKSGYSGFSGFSGYSGFSGANPGASGFSGTSGFSGFSGFSGVGTSGYSGWSGYSGISGYSGSGKSGYSGFSGASPGASGFSGYSGSGVSGYSGYSGTGTSGYSGFSGRSGYSGLSGTSGFSGGAGTSYWDSTAEVTGSDFGTTNTTLTDISGLSLALLANSRYEFEAVLDCATTADPNGTKYSANFSASGASIYGLCFGPTDNTHGSTAPFTINTAAQTLLGFTSLEGLVVIKGMCITGSNAGNLTIQTLKNTSGTSTVRIGSILKIHKL